MKNLLLALDAATLSINVYAEDLETYSCTYLENHFLKMIDKDKVNAVYELGAHRGLDAILLERYYYCEVIAFEANPVFATTVRENIARYNIPVTLIEKAISETSGTLSFYCCTSHPGCSSIFPFDFKSMINVHNVHEATVADLAAHYISEVITVESTKLDDFIENTNAPSPDLLCIAI
jgi:FkbM family methyltransferase